MFIAITHSKPGQRCMVQLDAYCVPFGTDAQAEAFVSLLRSRIAAPHRLPPLPRQASKPEFCSGKPAVKRPAVQA